MNKIRIEKSIKFIHTNSDSFIFFLSFIALIIWRGLCTQTVLLRSLFFYKHPLEHDSQRRRSLNRQDGKQVSIYANLASYCHSECQFHNSIQLMQFDHHHSMFNRFIHLHVHCTLYIVQLVQVHTSIAMIFVRTKSNKNGFTRWSNLFSNFRCFTDYYKLQYHHHIKKKEVDKMPYALKWVKKPISHV